eukprot:1162077-Pelagomonas_calceolata.AAC.1
MPFSLLQQSIEVSENISQAIPDWFFPNVAGSSARHQSHPDAVFVCSIPGRPSHIDPTKIPPQDRDIHLVGFKFCPDTKPFPTLEAATAQHASTITRLKSSSSRNPDRNNKALSIMTTPFNRFINLGLTGQKAKSLASKLCCHAIQT